MTSWTLAATEPSWSTRRSRAFLIGVHVPFLLIAPLITATGLDGQPHSPLMVAALAVAIGAVQLRHSLATARNERPAYWQLTLIALGLLVFGPIVWFGDDWCSTVWMFVASSAMLLTGRPRLALVVVPIIGVSVYTAVWEGLNRNGSVPIDLWDILYWSAALAGGAICLFSAAHIVRAVDDLYSTRTALAESTVGQERLRLSRDLHDLLGQSLSAVSLKGDLARALLRGNDHSAAEHEILSLADVACEALRKVRQVVHDEHEVSLCTETRGAFDLLTAASITTTIEVNVDRLARPIDELLGWATREGVTNVLRHSEPAACSIRVARADGIVTLEIVNDGVRTTGQDGTGLAGLAQRALALSGSVTTEALSHGRFRLMVEVPEVFP